ncbi:trans-Golgi network-localized SYP41-interacting protein 1 [Actinidia eriantha]|uniref:trans-Golgi network-localized SYP41-interacting protein 1 n=1 Tax=Actinidia eriantha TaxID=165200 RepID=UPI00258EBFA2|nr:trans-Golgi network-localized SYP41-interacting protein 1 [Actinidia eriantha]
MHSHSVSLSKSSGKMVKPGVSKLIQAFESKAHQDDHDADYVPSTENQLLVDSFMFTKEQTRNLRAVLKELLLNTENASVLFKGERDCRIQVDAALGELKFTCEALKEHNNSSEAANLELLVLYEFIKQHLCDIGAKKGELLAMYGALRQQSIVLEAENSKLVKKLGDYQSRISELERQLDGMHSSSDEMASSISSQVEALHKEVSERALILEQQWDSTVAQVVLTIGKLDSLIESSYSTTLSTGNGSLDLGSRVVVSVSAATTVIEDLREKLEASSKDHEAMCNTYKDMTEKFNDLHVKNELAIGVLHRIYGNLRKLVNDSCGHVEQSQIIEVNENLLDPLHHDNYDTLMEQLAVFLGERLQFKSVNSKLNSELIDKAKDMEVLKKRGFESDTILKLVEDVEGAIKLESTGIDSDKLESRLQALIYFLFQKYKEAEEQVSLSKETNFCKELELSELQGQIDHLSILIVQHENESLILKESMRQGAEHLVVVQSELHDKVNELEQSEQRVSSIREKLSIAVSKGKGLIVQRDNLKKSLAETSNELEKCSQELQLKDARLQEVEAKLKTYSEAGERVEALESELSYIRNSATALRESFILKDSVLQRIEEILEDQELPEHFHSRDIIEKVDWLARSVTGNSLPLTDWDPKSSVGGGSYSDTGFVSMDAWKEDTHPNSNSADDLRRKYEELQSKFYGLAEQNEMLEQSLMERNNVVQRWEDILERINIPLQLRSMEPEDRIEWLGSALSEAQQHCDALQRQVYNFETYCDSLQQKVDNLETYCATLTTDLEESQKRFSDLEAALQAVIREKEHLSESLDILTRDYDKVSEKAVQFEVDNDKLQNEVTALKDKLVEKVGNQDHIDHIEGEITRLEKLVSDVLQNSDTDDGVSGGSSTECLERILRKLVEKYTTLSSEKPSLVYSVDEQTKEKAGAIPEGKRDSEGSEEQDLAVLKKELEDALHDLMCVKEERDRYMESNQSLTLEVESLVMKRQELQELLSQEEQKSVSVREKLNVAVRKGKSLVQQRDSLKQTIEEVNNEVERLKSEINNRESSLSDYELKIKHLSTYQERVGLLESESLFLKNRLAETEYSLHEKTHILSLILNALNDNDTDLVFNISDPVEKLEQIGKQWRDLHAAVASSENDIRKSKRAAELLLAELNEVQERNDGLQEELVNASSELSELSRERDLAEAAKREAFSRFEKLSSIHFEERNNQFAELMVLKSCVDQLMKDFFDINDLLADILSKDLEYLHNLEVNMISCLDPSEALNMVGQPLGGPRSITSANAENKETFLATSSLLDLKMQEHIDDSNFVEIVILLGHQLQVFMKEIGCHKESLYKHLIALDEGAKHVSGVAGVVRREVTSQKQSCESMKENIIRLECIEKEKDTESIVMRRNISLLYEACSGSVMEIENWKSQFVGNDLAATDMGLNSGSSISLDGWKLFSDQTLLFSEDNIRTMADKLLSAVKDFICIQAKIVGGGQKEMKTTISNLQKELQEKDIQKDRICVELVSQIKEAEATASSYLQDFQSAKAQLYDSERRLEVMEEERNTLEQRVKELQDGEATLKDLDERVRSLNDALAAKEQEIEVLMQALDEEETQMEELTNKIGELERVVQQKNVGMENLEASRGKVMKKLSVTVSKFDELHHLSASLLSEVEKLQSQLQERDTEISFLRQEVTRCTNDALVASQMSNKRNSDEIQDLLTWLDTMISGLQLHDVHYDDQKREQVHEYKEMFQKHIMCLVSELEDLREVVQSRDMLLQVERSKVEELTRKGESLENSLREKESQLTGHQGVGDSGQTGSTASEITEVQPVINKWVPPGTSITPQVRSLRKVNNDQVAIAIDMEPGSGGRLEDEDDDKAHGFKSLTTSRIVPRFTRPVTDMIDGLWVSCDRALMRQPALRLGVIIYWALLHTLLATFVV